MHAVVLFFEGADITCEAGDCSCVSISNDGPNSQTVLSGEDVAFICNVTGVNGTAVQWIKGSTTSTPLGSNPEIPCKYNKTACD